MNLGLLKLWWEGYSNYVFNDGEVKTTASQWKKEIEYDSTHWGIDVPAQRKTLSNQTFGEVNLLLLAPS